MPISLNDMMKEIPPDGRARVERDAAALVAEHHRRNARSEPELERAAVGTKARTGQICPESGIWKVENTASVTAPIAIHNVMPPYGNRAVTWVLLQHA